MTREELLNRLALLEFEGKISLAEAQQILAQFDAGTLNEADLPMTREEENRLLLLSFLAISAGAFVADVRQRLRRVRGQQRRFVVIDIFEEQLEPLGGFFARTDPDIALWHQNMATVIRDNAFAMGEAALGRRLFEAEADQVRQALRAQYGYLERFADEIAFRKLVGRPMSEAAIFDRSRQYGGFAIGMFYRFAEARFARLPGYVARYIPIDDGGTCVPCHEAGRIEYYLPTEGPMPGEVCVAKGKCRCERIIEFNPAIYRTLL